MTWQSAVVPSCAPRLDHRPPGAVGSFGPEAVELAAEAGLLLDDWQAWYLDCALAYGPGGRWVSFENGLVVPRQDGKGAIIEARMLAGLFLLEERLLTYTAHEFKTAQEHFHRIVNLVEGTPRLRKLVRHIRRASGAEAIELNSGARLRFLARSAGSGRGFSGDVVFLDEAMMLWAAAMGALLPTMSARTHVTAGGPQLWYAGTAGHGEQTAVFASVRDRAIVGTDESLFFAEWSAGEAADHTGSKVDLDDRSGWWSANPAMHGGGRITEEFVQRERAALTDDEFARERLCVWGGAGAGSVIDADTWRGLSVSQFRPSGKLVFAVDVPPEGGRASIARAVESEDGMVYVEVDVRPGTLWAQDRLVELGQRRRAPIVLDPGSRAGSLLAGLIEGRAKPKTVSVRELTAACGQFVDFVEAGKIRHFGQPELALAVDAARKRQVGDAWAWHRRDTSVDISPLVAATLAVYGLRFAGRKQTGRSLAV